MLLHFNSNAGPINKAVQSVERGLDSTKSCRRSNAGAHTYGVCAVLTLECTTIFDNINNAKLS